MKKKIKIEQLIPFLFLGFYHLYVDKLDLDSSVKIGILLLFILISLIIFVRNRAQIVFKSKLYVAISIGATILISAFFYYSI